MFTQVAQEVTDIVKPLILLPTTGEDIFDNIVVKPVFEIDEKETVFRENGGKWVIPIGSVDVI